MTEKNPTEDDPENMFIDVNRYEVQESAIFQQYSLQVIQKSLDAYKSLNLYERTSLAKNIDSIRMLYNKQDVNSFLFQAGDNQDIQRQILIFIKQLHHFKQEINIQAEIVNPLVKIITGPSLQLKEIGCLFLEEVLPNMKETDRKDMVQLAQNLDKKQDQESKIGALQIISRVSKDLTQAEVSEVFGKFFRQSYSKGSVRLKKQIIHNCALFAAGVSEQYFHFQILQQFFLEKCKEPVWGIRKACVQALPKLVKLTNKNKKQTLSVTLLNYTKDGSKIVRLSAYKIIPQFIAHYDSTTIPNAVFQLFCSLPKHQINKQVNRENEIIQKIAFYLPGVLHVCGVSKWPQIKTVMQKLLDMKSQEVRLPIASSIHEITRIIGSGLASQVMFHVVDAFLKDQSQQLNLAVVKRFTDFMGIFDKTTRQNLIDFFLVIQNDPKKWRVRFQIARQLGLLTQYYEVDIIFQYLFPIGLKLCNDTRSSVREQAASHMHEIVEKMAQNQALQHSTIDSIICLGNSLVYRQRLILAYMVQKMSRIAAFRKKLGQMLIQLAKDKVVGVRTALAHSLVRCDKNKDWIGQLQSSIDILSKDQEDCVRNELNL